MRMANGVLVMKGTSHDGDETTSRSYDAIRDAQRGQRTIAN